ncbi:hypothetical protein DFJ74DRAFT_707018 [Hyaloraphidium curvatum]|nr:hypothetical protein DFJ74DRAFT_707018 [Hyaloraphidium curvatum]
MSPTRKTRAALAALLAALPLSAAVPISQPTLVCFANIATQLTFTLNNSLAVDVVLVGGGGGGSSTNGRGGGGGSTALDFGSTHLYAAGGHGGIQSTDPSVGWSGTDGAYRSYTGITLPPGTPITVTVGGGGGAGNVQCTASGKDQDPNKALTCYAGGGGGGAGAYGGGGGAADKDSGGAGGESAGPRIGGAHGGHGQPGTQWNGGQGEDPPNHYPAGPGGAGGQGAQGSQTSCKAGNGGGFGSGGGSPPQPLYYYMTSGQPYPWGGTGGTNGGKGGAARTDGAPGEPNFSYGWNTGGQGACAFVPTGVAVPPYGAGAGGFGTKDPQNDGPIHGGNAGYAIVSYASPDGVSCPVPSQTRADGSAVNGSYCA